MTAEDLELVSVALCGFRNEPYIVEHFIAGFQPLCCEEFLERFLFLAVWANQ